MPPSTDFVNTLTEAAYLLFILRFDLVHCVSFGSGGGM